MIHDVKIMAMGWGGFIAAWVSTIDGFQFVTWSLGCVFLLLGIINRCLDMRKKLRNEDKGTIK